MLKLKNYWIKALIKDISKTQGFYLYYIIINYINMYILILDVEHRQVFWIYNTEYKAIQARLKFLEKTNYKNNIVIETHKINSNIFE